jgi:hypothetical protein
MEWIMANWKVINAGHKLDLGYGFQCSVIWDACRPKGSDIPPYVVSVNGARLKERFTEADIAKVAAERTAREMIDKISAALSEASE